MDDCRHCAHAPGRIQHIANGTSDNRASCHGAVKALAASADAAPAGADDAATTAWSDTTHVPSSDAAVASAIVEIVALPPDDQVYLEGYVLVQRHFIEGLLTGAEHETRAADNLKTMDVVWAAYRSAEEGRTQLL